MEKQGENNIKLGVFVLAGLLTIILSFYMIGKNRDLFGSNFQLKARFSNLNGLTEGNNVLFSGIQAGTVKTIAIYNDTTIEVTLQISDKLKSYIHKNALVSIGTEGLMGDKVINIIPQKKPSPLIAAGDLLANRENVSTDDMLQTLSKTNNNIALISEALKSTVMRINNSSVWDVLNDKGMGQNVHSILTNINKASENANELTSGLNNTISQIKQGKGAAGLLLTDTAFSSGLNLAMAKIKAASDHANNLTIKLNNVVNELNGDISNGNGTLHLLLNDSTFANNLRRSMENIQNGTGSFSQDMEALKHNFLLRGYFKNLEKQQKKAKASEKLNN